MILQHPLYDNLAMYSELLPRGFLFQAPFEEKRRHYFDFQRRTGQLPVQKEV